MPGRLVAHTLGESDEAFRARGGGIQRGAAQRQAPTDGGRASTEGAASDAADKLLDAAAPGQRAMHGWVGGSLAGLVGSLCNDLNPYIRGFAMLFMVCVLYDRLLPDGGGSSAMAFAPGEWP
eukprot:3927370-Prymnesium_polylepis.1